MSADVLYSMAKMIGIVLKMEFMIHFYLQQHSFVPNKDFALMFVVGFFGGVHRSEERN